MAENHELMGGKLHVYKRENSSVWQCSAFLAGKNRRKSTKEESLSHAKEIAEDWYLELRGKARAGQIKDGKKFQEAAEQFLLEYPVMTAGQRNEKYVAGKEQKLRLHILPFFGDLILPEITSGTSQEYRLRRMQHKSEDGTPAPPSRSTLHQEIVTVRQVLKTANRKGWLAYVPDLSSPYKSSGKITHRAWFSPEEYQMLYKATGKRARTPLHGRHRWACEQLHDYVLFMANTGLRPDEVARLEFRDVKIVKDRATKQIILEIEVRGKRGIGWCKSTTNAVLPFQRLQERPRRKLQAENGVEKFIEIKPGATDRIFPTTHRGLLNIILGELELKTDRDCNHRTAYSLRHTYICFRLIEGADIYQIAKNCRTSVEMIEKFYASHIKTRLDASAINVTSGAIRAEREAREGGPIQAPRRVRNKGRGGGPNETTRSGRNGRAGGRQRYAPKGART
jgi:integrase